ncbi:hypothetical protein CgunFtcFv8_010672 [Champsocephalus gunnari]|uniref:Ig-like domain-containing protein n=1 Tax=Champsocephalus gunnari TaxID=52237 RepID=A0AAN8E396_CHAGU|nr:hypothetical protein CgunFtcFv8_010672 [Champsocephalus gunnari]
MNPVIFLCVLSMLPQLGALSVAPFRAVVEMVSGDSRIFSGESVRLKCSVPDVRSSWSHLWFRGSEQLPQRGQHLILWEMKVQESGKYYCKGVRDSHVGDVITLQSLPLEINVDGGWLILQVPAEPSLVSDTLKEQGVYSCRASWDTDRRTHSVISADASVQILDVLSLPVLEIVADSDLIPVNKMKLICHLQYNARAPAPPINYYFYKNDIRLGIATSENHDLVRRTPGQYSCKAKVPVLGISRWSEVKSFEQAKGRGIMLHPDLRPRNSRPFAPSISSPQTSRPPADEPTEVQPSLHQSTQTPTFTEPTEVSSIQTSSPAPKPSQPAPNTLQSTVQSLSQTPAPVDIFEELSDETSAESDVSWSSGGSAESDDIPKDSPDASLW